MLENKSKKANILIIDDDESFSKSLSFTLKRKGFNVEFATSFNEGLKKAEEKHFNIALVDIKLQDKSGVELVKPLKEINPEMAIMMITGHASVSTAIESVNLEISAYFTKPVDMNILLKTINEALEKQDLVIRNKELIIQVQKELEERKLAEEKYRMLVETSPNAILLLDLEGKLIFVNNQFLTMRGYENEDEVLGRNIADFSQTNRNKHAKTIKKLLATKKPVLERETFLHRKDGSIFPAEVNMSIILNEQGEPIFLTVIQKDITEKKKNENELAIRNQISHLYATKPEKEIYTEILNAVLKALNSKKGIFGFINEQGDLICPSIKGKIWDECQIPDKSIVFPRKSWGDTFWGRALNDRETHYSNEQLTTIPNGHIPIERHLFAPIVYRGEAIGLIYIANKETNYTDDDVLLMKMITKHLAPILSSKLQKNIEEAQRKKAEWEREDAIKDLEKIFLFSPSLQFTTSLDGYFKRINPAFCKTFGYSENEVLASSFIDYVHPDDLEESLPNIGTLRSGLKTIKFINRFRCKNGDYKWIECISNPVVKDGITYSIAQDITDRKLAEGKLKDSEEKYRTLIETAPNGIMVADFSGTITFVNKQLVTIFGLNSIDDIIGKKIAELVPTANPKRFQSNKSILDSFKKPFAIQTAFEKMDGSKIYLEIIHTFIGNSIGQPTAYLAYVTDVTDRQKAEEEIKESELRYRTFFKAAFDSIMVIKEERFVDCNDVVLQRYGYKSKDEILGLSPWEISPSKQPDGQSSKQKVMKFINAAFAGDPQRFYWQHKTRNGTLFDVDVSLNYFEMHGESYLLVMWRDITERKKADVALQKSEELYRIVFESTGTAMLLTADRKVVVCNAKFLELFGYKREEIEGEPWLKWIYEPDRKRLLQKSNDIRNKPDLLPLELEFRLIRKDGNVRVVSIFIDAIPGKSQTVASIQDITERKEAELELKRSEELYRTVFESTGTAMLLTADRKVVVCNTKFLDVFGYKREEIEGQFWTKWIFEHDLERILEISSGEESSISKFPIETEFRIIRANGDVRIVFAVIDLIPETSQTVVSVQDITNRRNLEEVRNQVNEQLERNMEQFAILVDSIRNPLAVIVGFADVYPEDVTNKIVKQVKLVDDIISELDLRFLESENVRNFLKKHT